MKKFKLSMLAIGLAVVLLFQTGCIGSFSLTKKVYNWNTSYDKFASEAIFLAFIILPVYEATLFIDAIVLNTIEFWSGNNPVSKSGSRSDLKIAQQDGRVYELSEKNDLVALKITKDARLLSYSELYLDRKDKSVFIKIDNKFVKIVEIVPAKEGNPEYAILYAKGRKIKVDINSGSMDEIKARVNKEIQSIELSSASPAVPGN